MARSSEPIIFLLLLVSLESVKGYPGGAPPSVCASMAPSIEQLPVGHGASPQTDASPYAVAINVPARRAVKGESYDGM